MNLADLIGSDDPELGPAAGLQAANLLASAGHYVRRAPWIFNLDEHTVIGAKYREDLDTRTQHYPSLYRAIFNGASVTGQGTVVTRNSTLIHDSCWELFAQGVLPDGLERSSGDVLALRDMPSRRIERPSLLLKRPWWRSYGHWLVDSAALLALMPGLAMPRDWQIVIGRYDEPRMRQVVHEVLGFLAPGVPVLEHWDHETWTFDELHYTTPVSRPPLFKLPQAIAALRALVLSSYPSRSGRRKLYVSRGPDKARRLENEEEIMSLCVAAGFEIIRPENYPLRQQAQLFNSAEIIVGAKGAALTNLLFCNSSAAVIVLSPSSWAESFYWDIAGQIGIKYIEVIGNPTAASESPATLPFAIDTGLVVQALADAGAPRIPKQLITELWASDRRTIVQDEPYTANDLPVPMAPKAAVDHNGDAYEDATLAEHQAALPVTDTAPLDDIVRSSSLLAAATPSADPLQGVVLAHIHNVGDVEARLGDWIGIRGSDRWVEGIQVTPSSGIARDEIEYQVVHGVDQLSSWTQGGEFCGTRGMSLPIRGLGVRLCGAAVERYECAYSAAFADGAERELVTAGNVCAAASLAPLEAFQIVLRPRLALPPDAPKDQSALSPEELMLQFESLGDNCELGLVQRWAGVEPLDLLRFAGFLAPIEHRLRLTIDALTDGFSDLGSPASVVCELHGDQPPRQFMIQQTRWNLLYHTERYEGEIDQGVLHAQQVKALHFKRRKLLEDLGSAHRVFVWKSNIPTPEADIRNLVECLRRYGQNLLLWVQVADLDHPMGLVEYAGDGLLKGYVARFAPYEAAGDIDHGSWLLLCRTAAMAADFLRHCGEWSSSPPDEQQLRIAPPPLEEVHLKDVASDIVWVERQSATPDPGPVLVNTRSFQSPQTWQWFRRSPGSVDIRSADLNDVVSDTTCAVLIHRGQKIRETRNLLDDREYGNVHVSLPGLRFAQTDKVAVIGFNRAWQNYYHWMTQCLPSIELSVRHIGAQNCVLAVPSLSAWQEETLALLGLADIPRIQIDLHHHYYFRRVRFCEYLNGSAAFFLSPRLLELFDRLATNIEPASDSPGLVYVSRADSDNRPVANEQEVERLLVTKGFVSVIPGSHSVQEQIRLFKGARIVVGAHGAGLTNIAFCRPGTKILELIQASYVNPCMNRLAQARRLEYHAECFDSAASVDVHRQAWSVDIERLATKLRSIVGQRLCPIETGSSTVAG